LYLTTGHVGVLHCKYSEKDNAVIKLKREIGSSNVYNDYPIEKRERRRYPLT